MAPVRFRDRREAGMRLARALDAYRMEPDVYVLALPRGGVPVAYEVALALQAPLDVFLVRKLGVPGRPEMALGALASGGLVVLNQDVISVLRLRTETINEIASREQQELSRREAAYRGDRPRLDLRAKTIIVVDDGLATGATMRAAIAALRQREPSRLVAAVPVGAEATCEALQSEVDELVCLSSPADFRAVGLWYDDFSQTSDDEVRRLLRASRS